MRSQSRYLFVYSSLRKGFQQSAFDYLTQFFHFVSDARAKGILSVLEGIAVGTPVDNAQYIKGELYELNVTDGSYVFGQLDDYEGVIAEEGKKPMYRRALTMVYTDEGNAIEAWVYWYTGDVAGRPIIPSGDILDFLHPNG